MRKAASHLDAMLALGVTTVECKSGYGLDFESEIKALLKLDYRFSAFSAGREEE